MTTALPLMQWIDLFWVPVALLAMERGRKIKTALFVLACAFLLRLQVELLQQIGYPRGFFGLMQSDILIRGQIIYSVFILFFLLLAFFSPGANKHVYLAASITVMIAAFCVSFLIMVL